MSMSNQLQFGTDPNRHVSVHDAMHGPSETAFYAEWCFQCQIKQLESKNRQLEIELFQAESNLSSQLLNIDLAARKAQNAEDTYAFKNKELEEMVAQFNEENGKLKQDLKCKEAINMALLKEKRATANQHTDLLVKIRKLEGNVIQVGEELQQIKLEKSGLTKLLMEKEGAMRVRDQEISFLQETIEDLRTLVQENNARLLERQIDEKEKEKLEVVNSQLGSEHNALRNENAALKFILRKIEADKLQLNKTLNQLNQSLASEEKRNVELFKTVESMRHLLSESEKKREAFENEVKTTKEILLNKDKEIEFMKNSMENLKRQLDLAQCTALRNEKDTEAKSATKKIESRLRKRKMSDNNVKEVGVSGKTNRQIKVPQRYTSVYDLRYSHERTDKAKKNGQEKETQTRRKRKQKYRLNCRGLAK